MKKAILILAGTLLALSVSAQSVNGLNYGGFYTQEEISTAFGAQTGVDPTNSQVLKFGGSSFIFDIANPTEDGKIRLLGVDIRDARHVVKFPLGEFKVGDPLTKILYLRGDLEIVGQPENTCRLSYYNKNDRKVCVTLELDAEKNIKAIYDLSVGGKKPATKERVSRFYEALPIVETAGVELKAGDTLDKLLGANVNIEFSSYGNGICRIYNEKVQEQYLVRYDLDHIIKEILLF